MNAGADVLLKHLQNLKKKKVKHANFDVDWLLTVVTELTATPPTATKVVPSGPIVLDGGGFNDDRD